MPSVLFLEQRPPFIIMLASRASTYTHVIISLFAVLLFQAFPSWGIAKPPTRDYTRKRRSSSVTSSTPTLVGTDEGILVKKEIIEPEKATAKLHRVSFSTKIPFNKLNSSVKDAISRGKSIKPRVPRRFSLPARRFSTHIVTALNNLTPRHHRPEEMADSYFSRVERTVQADNVNGADVIMPERSAGTPVHIAVPIAVTVSIIESTKIEKVEGDKPIVEQTTSYVSVDSTQRKKTFRQFAKRASFILGDLRIHRRRS